MSLESKESELRSNYQETFSSAGKNTRLVLVPCCALKYVPKAISGGVDIPEVSGCHLLSQVGS